MHTTKWIFITVIALFTCSIASASSATPHAFQQRNDIKKYVAAISKHFHFEQAKLTKLFNQAKLQRVAIQKMQRPNEALSWSRYKHLFITHSRVSNGVTFWHHHERSLHYAEKHYGVPANLIVAIIGIESSYGKIMGQFPVFDTLATLAFNYPPRANFFRDELTQYLLMARSNHITPRSLKGSYAGAIGIPQFMPSSYRHFAIDYDHNHHIDLTTNANDAIVSIANYLFRNGWQAKQKVAIQANCTSSYCRRHHNHLQKPHHSIQYFINHGVHPQHHIPLSDKALLIKLQGHYWLALHNFYVITRYNTSEKYAMAAYQLSQLIRSKYKLN